MNDYKQLLQEGFMAYYTRAKCPYPSNSREAEHWKEGWDIAFNSYYDIELTALAKKKTHFYRDNCCIIKYERQGQDIDWMLEEIYGPFINYVEAERWQQMPENYIDNNPKLRYTIQYLTDPGL